MDGCVWNMDFVIGCEISTSWLGNTNFTNWWTVGGQLADSRRTIRGQSVDTWWIVGGQSVDSRWTVGGQSVDSRCT